MGEALILARWVRSLPSLPTGSAITVGVRLLSYCCSLSFSKVAASSECSDPGRAGPGTRTVPRLGSKLFFQNL